jgi:hypothetical protein
MRCRSLPCGLALLVFSALPAAASEAYEISLLAGAFDVGDLHFDVGEVGLEARWAPRFRDRLPECLTLRPILGAAGTGDGAAWIYAGLAAEWRVAARWVLAPGLGVALRAEGDGKPLGGPVAFRSSIEAARRLGDRLRLGLAFYHLSNASLYKENPGSNSLVVRLAVSLPRR